LRDALPTCEPRRSYTSFSSAPSVASKQQPPDAAASLLRASREPISRMGTPAEVAAAVLWRCSDQAAFTIGHAMVVDGGQTA
jgi:NAD(P)-dependent dehydrogenase (short-subunit alcohol dehydrogenase family)